MQGFLTLGPRTGTRSWPVQIRAACRRRALAVREPLCLTAGHSLLSGWPCLRLRAQPPVRTSGNQTQGAASCEDGGTSDSGSSLLWEPQGLRFRAWPNVRTAGLRLRAWPPLRTAGLRLRARPPVRTAGLRLRAQPPVRKAGLRLTAQPPVRMAAGLRLRARPLVRTAGPQTWRSPDSAAAAHEGRLECSLEPSRNHPHPQAAEKWSTTEPVPGATEIGSRCINAFLITY